METEYKIFRDKIKTVESSNLRRERQIVEKMKSFFQIEEIVDF
jgi:hypothetical protein